VVGGKVVYNDPQIQIESSAVAGIALQPPVLAIALLLSWPWRSASELGARFALAVPLLLLVMLLDLPIILYGSAWYAELSRLDAGRFSPLVTWADFMNAGGRFVLTIIAVASAVRIGATLTSNTRRG
jgi:hypothetical protein